MKSYGDLYMVGQECRLQRVSLGLMPDFPDLPKAGNMVFKNKKLYIYAIINTVGIWWPITKELVYYQANFTDINPWVCMHDLESSETILQVYDTDNNMLIPDDIDQSVPGRTIVSFNQNMSGRIFIIQRLANTDRINVYLAGTGGDVLLNEQGNYLAGS